MKKSVKKRRSYLIKKNVWIIVILLLFAAAAWYLFTRNDSSPPGSSSQSTAKGTPSKLSPHDTPPTTSNSPGRQGGVIDQKGQSSAPVSPSSQWTSSSNGDITLQGPASGQAIKSGDTISGLAKVNTIQFILKDSAVGVISQGSLSVVNGKFSGVLNFTAHSKAGELEVYYPDPTTGAEKNIINIDVNFNI